MKHVIVFLADGFEECEALASVDLLRRANVEVLTASVMGRIDVRGAHDVVVMADTLAENADFNKADMIVLPGGGIGTQNLVKSEIVRKQCIEFSRRKIVAAICAAPTVLAKYGLLDGRKATVYPGMEEQLTGADSTGDMVTVDRNIITGKGPGAAFKFGIELIRQLLDDETADSVKKSFVLD